MGNVIEQIKQEINQSIKHDLTINKLANSKPLSYETVHKISQMIGEHTKQAISKYIHEDMLPNKSMTEDLASVLTDEILRSNYQTISQACLVAQQDLNDKYDIHLKPIKSPYNEEKAQGIAKYISEAKTYHTREKSFLESYSTFGKSIVNDHVKANADFHYQNGMEPVIIRTGHSDMCDWCSKLVGTYKYSEVKDTGNDVFRRHNNCNCMVVYKPFKHSKIVTDAHSKIDMKTSEYNEKVIKLSQTEAIDYMARFKEDKRVSTKIEDRDINIHLKRVDNEDFEIWCDYKMSKKNGSIKTTIQNLKTAQEVMKKSGRETSIPAVYLLDFEKNNISTKEQKAMAGYFLKDNVIYVNSKYKNNALILEAMGDNDYFSSDRPIHPLLHELGHKRFYEILEQKKKEGYNDFEEVLRKNIKNEDLKVKDLSGHAANNLESGNIGEVFAEYFATNKDIKVIQIIESLVK